MNLARHPALGAVLVLVLGVLAMWASLEIGWVRGPYVTGLQGLASDTGLLCAAPGQAQEVLDETGMSHGYGMLLLVPLPFALIAGVGYLLVRAARRERLES